MRVYSVRVDEGLGSGACGLVYLDQGIDGGVIDHHVLFRVSILEAQDVAWLYAYGHGHFTLGVENKQVTRDGEPVQGGVVSRFGEDPGDGFDCLWIGELLLTRIIEGS